MAGGSTISRARVYMGSRFALGMHFEWDNSNLTQSHIISRHRGILPPVGEENRGSENSALLTV
jgi:hypothetical protein